jgi:hypothetical protein
MPPWFEEGSRDAFAKAQCALIADGRYPTACARADAQASSLRACPFHLVTRGVMAAIGGLVFAFTCSPALALAAQQLWVHQAAAIAR